MIASATPPFLRPATPSIAHKYTKHQSINQQLSLQNHALLLMIKNTFITFHSRFALDASIATAAACTTVHKANSVVAMAMRFLLALLVLALPRTTASNTTATTLSNEATALAVASAAALREAASSATAAATALMHA